jgi:tetratricopeptide (TPR) repeat protein
MKEPPTAAKYLILARRAFERDEFGKALQLAEEGLLLEPQNTSLLEMEEKASASLRELSNNIAAENSRLNEAAHYSLQAGFILNDLQANIAVYGSNSPLAGANPADVDIGLKYVDRALELSPDNAVYLNQKALLLAEGKGDKASAIKLLEKAHALSPRDINIEQNLKDAKSNGCFVATAALGSADDPTVVGLRKWRDEYLIHRKWGRTFVFHYYRVSPDLSKLISRRPILKRCVRAMLLVFVFLIQALKKMKSRDG